MVYKRIKKSDHNPWNPQIQAKSSFLQSRPFELPEPFNPDTEKSEREPEPKAGKGFDYDLTNILISAPSEPALSNQPSLQKASVETSQLIQAKTADQVPHVRGCICPSCTPIQLQQTPSTNYPIIQRYVPTGLPEFASQKLQRLDILRIFFVGPISSTVDTLLSYEQIDGIIDNASDILSTDIDRILEESLTELPDPHSHDFDQLQPYADQLVKVCEREFILDPNTSSLDLLPENRGERYRDFSWQKHDYPGGLSGSNEARARRMHRQLRGIHPERRPNTGRDRVLSESEFDRHRNIEAKIRRNLEEVPVFTENLPGESSPPEQPANKQIHRLALEAFLRLRNAAFAEGIPIIVRAGWRSRARARRNAEAANNPGAVASYSSHTLGLAVDLQMGVLGQEYQEIHTRPMSNVVNMRQSPAHKWMFMRAPEYGWYAWNNEPWHWEYNPQGFRDQYLDSLETDTGAAIEVNEEEHE